MVRLMARQLAPTVYAALKTASRLLVDDVGGIDAAASVTRLARSGIAEHASPQHGDRFFPVDVLLDLESRATRPIVLEVLARQLGYELMPLALPEAGDLGRRLQAVSRDAGQTMADAVAMLLGQSEADPREAEAVLADLTQLHADTDRAIAALRARLGGGKEHG